MSYPSSHNTPVRIILNVCYFSLLFTGEELQCGRHGYSARDYGFRFDIEMGGDTSKKVEEKTKKEEKVTKMKEKGLKGSKGVRSQEGEKGEGSADSVNTVKAEKTKGGENDEEEAEEEEEEEGTDVEEGVSPPTHPHAGDPLLVEDPGELYDCTCTLLCLCY